MTSNRVHFSVSRSLNQSKKSFQNFFPRTFLTFAYRQIRLGSKRNFLCSVEELGIAVRSYGNKGGSLRESGKLFEVLPDFHECYNNFLDTGKESFLFLSENETLRKFSVSIALLWNGFHPISARSLFF